ncbi:synaptonemal complex protein 1 isoform X3 [Aethina tumida]|uniref:synaptonemal complex protein 1 isoform X3 n=1 Tax=Aethina tumida TaxID=116153 RepID=UPI0021478B84|nr:synaptonemal complex protein 1 isoform X3 [Aethina tumida]
MYKNVCTCLSKGGNLPVIKSKVNLAFEHSQRNICSDGLPELDRLKKKFKSSTSVRKENDASTTKPSETVIHNRPSSLNTGTTRNLSTEDLFKKLRENSHKKLLKNNYNCLWRKIKKSSSPAINIGHDLDNGEYDLYPCAKPIWSTNDLFIKVKLASKRESLNENMSCNDIPSSGGYSDYLVDVEKSPLTKINHQNTAGLKTRSRSASIRFTFEKSVTPKLIEDFKNSKDKYYKVNRNKSFCYLEPDPDFETFVKMRRRNEHARRKGFKLESTNIEVKSAEIESMRLGIQNANRKIMGLTTNKRNKSTKANDLIEVMPANQIPLIREDPKKKEKEKREDKKSDKKNMRLPPKKENPALRLDPPPTELTDAIKNIQNEITTINETLKLLTKKMLMREEQNSKVTIGFRHSSPRPIKTFSKKNLTDSTVNPCDTILDKKKVTVETLVPASVFPYSFTKATEEKVPRYTLKKKRESKADYYNRLVREQKKDRLQAFVEEVGLRQRLKSLGERQKKIFNHFPSELELQRTQLARLNQQLSCDREKACCSGHDCHVGEKYHCHHDHENDDCRHRHAGHKHCEIEELYTKKLDDADTCSCPCSKNCNIRCSESEIELSNKGALEKLFSRKEEELLASKALKTKQQFMDTYKSLMDRKQILEIKLIHKERENEKKVKEKEKPKDSKTASIDKLFLKPEIKNSCYDIILESQENGIKTEIPLLKVNVPDERSKSYLHKIKKIEAKMEFNSEKEVSAFTTIFEDNQLTIKTEDDNCDHVMKKCMSLPNVQLKIYENTTPFSTLDKYTKVDIKQRKTSKSLLQLQVINDALQNYINGIRKVKAKIMINDKTTAKSKDSTCNLLKPSLSIDNINLLGNKNRSYSTQVPISRRYSSTIDKGDKDKPKNDKKKEPRLSEEDVITLAQVIQKIEDNLLKAAEEYWTVRNNEDKQVMKKFLDDPLVKIAPSTEKSGHPVGSLLKVMSDQNIKEKENLKEAIEESKKILKDKKGTPKASLGANELDYEEDTTVMASANSSGTFTMDQNVPVCNRTIADSAEELLEKYCVSDEEEHAKQFNYSDDEDELVNKDALCDDLIFRKHLRAEMSGNKKPTPPPGPKPSGTVKYLIPRLRYIIMKQKYNSDYANATIINVTRDADLQNPDNFLKVTHNGKIMYVNKSFKGLEEKTEEYEFKDKKKAKDHCDKVYLTPGQSLSKKALNKPFASDCAEKIAEDVKPGDMLQENIEPYEMVKVETTSKGRPVLSKQGRWIRNRSVDNSFYSLKPENLKRS